MSRVKCYNCKKEGHFTKDCKKVKVKDYEYFKTKMLLAKKYKDEQVLLAEDQAWMESSSDSDQEIIANMVFMAQIEKVLSDLEASSSSADEKISEVSYYLSDSETESEFETLVYYDNSTNFGLFVNNDDDQEIFHDAIVSASENFIENHIDSQNNYDKSDVDHNNSEEKDHLVDKLIRKFNKKIVKCQKRVEKANQQSKDFENQNKDLQEKYDVLINQVNTFEEKNNEDLKNTILEKDFKISELEEYVHNKDLEIEKCLERLNDCENKLHKMGQTNQTVHMMMPSKDNLYNGQKGIGFENLSYFEKAKDLRPTLYDEKVIGLGSLKPYVSNVILKKIIIDLEDEVVSLLEKEKANLETIKSLKSKGFESSENVSSESENQTENDCLVAEKECNKEENPKVIALGMFGNGYTRNGQKQSKKRQNQTQSGKDQKIRTSPAIVEPLRIELPFLENQFEEDPPPESLMADNRTMAELLQAPTEGYEDAIVIPEITANNFELKHGLINLVQNKQFFGHDKEDPHAHI
nr:reverse transcriptase domain-containing protein [Tanacetum cinerariifolium]